MEGPLPITPGISITTICKSEREDSQRLLRDHPLKRKPTHATIVVASLLNIDFRFIALRFLEIHKNSEVENRGATAGVANKKGGKTINTKVTRTFMSDASHLPIELIMRPSMPADRDGIHSSSNNDQQRGGAFADSVPQQVVAQVIPSQTYFPPGVGQGLLIPPQNRRMPATSQPKRSNLTALLEGQAADGTRASGKTTPVRGGDESATERRRHVEADSASGPTGFMDASSKARSAPMLGPDYKPPPRAKGPPPAGIPPTTVLTPRVLPSLSSSAEAHVELPTNSSGAQDNMASQVRRCISSKELGTLAPPSGSPYAAMLYQREILQATLQQRLMDARESNDFNDRSLTPSPGVQDASDGSDSSKRRAMLNNETRNRRRAEHNRAVTSDLCEIVTDLFIAEAKLLKAASYGFDSSLRRDQVLKNVINFVSALPPRYALGVDTPSEVLLHMRLMAAARSDHSRAVVHITKTDQSQDLVTISCADAQGLLEYITRMLATGGSRVLDADVMLSSDNIVLVRTILHVMVYALLNASGLTIFRNFRIAS